MLEKLFLEMISYYSGDPKRIQHFTKVHSYAKLIGEREQLSPGGNSIFWKQLHTRTISASSRRRRSMEAVRESCQEKEGPAVARGMLMRLGFAENVIERVCYLIGHHHTYTGIDGRDYQILVEADFLVNLYEDGRTDGDGRFMPDKAAVEAAYQRIFATETGKWICRSMFALEVCHDAGEEAEGNNSGIQFQGNLLSVQQLFRKSDRLRRLRNWDMR